MIYRHYKGNRYHHVLTAISGIDDRRAIVYAEKEIDAQPHMRLIARNPEFVADLNCYPEIEYFAILSVRGNWLALKTMLSSDRHIWEQSENKLWIRSVDNFHAQVGENLPRFRLETTPDGSYSNKKTHQENGSLLLGNTELF